MRPTAVRQAEWVYLAAIGLMIVSALLDVSMTATVARTGLVFALGVGVFFVGLWLLLLLFATRRGKRWARVGLVALTGLGAALILLQVATGQLPLGLVGVLNAVQAVLFIVGAVLLFRPAAQHWFAKRHFTWEEDR